MTQAIYQWVRNLAVYYMILTAVMHLMPNSQYGRYIRYFMGILLILIITSPLLGLLNLENRVDGLFQEKMLEEEFLYSQWGQAEGEAAAKEYYLQAYEQEVADQIQNSLGNILGEGCEVMEIRVHMDMDEQSRQLGVESVQVWLSGAENTQMREGVEHELAGTYGISGEKVELFFEKMG